MKHRGLISLALAAFIMCFPASQVAGASGAGQSDSNINWWVQVLIGGGVITAILSSVAAKKAEARARKAEHLKLQIQNLYGPLRFFTSQNQAFTDLNNKFDKAAKLTYDKALSDGERKELSTLTDTRNSYSGFIVQNNQRMTEIIRDNYAYIEPDDIEIFSHFLVNTARELTEKDETGCHKLSNSIHVQIGDISLIIPEFIKRVEDRFSSKKHELERLSK